MIEKQFTGLKRGLPPSTGPEDSEVNKKYKKNSNISPGKSTVSLSPSTPPATTPLKSTNNLPSPLTGNDSFLKDSNTTLFQEHGSVVIATPALESLESPKNKNTSASPTTSGSQTQPFSQLIYPPYKLAYEVADEEAECVWGYLLPIDGKSGKFGTLVFRERSTCSMPDAGRVQTRSPVKPDTYIEQEKHIEQDKIKDCPSQGYLIGRHPECDLRIDAITVSNRHCLIFFEKRNGNIVALLEDTSGNGTFVNDTLVGRNNRRELIDGDEVSILEEARFKFRYARHRSSSAFKQKYSLLDQLGKGHFATVYLCVDKATGSKWAVKKFDRPKDEKHLDGLHQEIAVLMAISHPSLLCLKGAFDETDGIYLILELASEGELFNYILANQKLSEDDTRKVFVQLFQAVKYLHDRSIVHRDIKPENILLCNEKLGIKLADFGLAKIIGEESFTTTLCGTPSYVSPEILQTSSKRRYTKAIDIWSLGVVLYICLCGFPPFSDELYTRENPFTMPQQILAGRYEFPSPYWDNISDAALDLIDQMLTVNPEKRICIDDCLEHPWTIGHRTVPTQANDSILSTDGLLAGKMSTLDYSERKPKRERTLLSELNRGHTKKPFLENETRGKDKPINLTRNNMEAGASGTRFLATGNTSDVPLFEDTANGKEGALL